MTSLVCVWLLIVVCLDSIHARRFRHTVSVDTSNGKLIGRRVDGVVEFLGIPYAEPPTGRHRFRPSIAKRPWYPAELKAFNYSAECLQSGLYADESVRSDEDCLYLNVWHPYKLHSPELLPVLVWIYGGAFLHGAASRREYAGHVLASKGVVVVSFNYRIGALGFLVSIEEGLLGNYGLHDQKLALQWVQDNIKLFGGDPQRVTVFGESAGAMSTALHLFDQHSSTHNLLNKPNPLFHSVILQSNPLGYKYGYSKFLRLRTNVPIRYRSLFVANFIGKSYKELLDCEDLQCLQAESADELIHVQDTLMAVPRSMGDFFTWGPVVTDSTYYREARVQRGPVSNVTVKQPLETIKELRKLSIPIILGTNSHEGIMFVHLAWPRRMFKLMYQGIVISFFRESAPKVLRLYSHLTKLIDKSPNPDYRFVLSQIIGDYLFRCPNLLFSSQAAKLGTPIFLYEFALPTRLPEYSFCNGLACHSCELAYPFCLIDVITSGYSWFGNDSENQNSTYNQRHLKKSDGFGVFEEVLRGLGLMPMSSDKIDERVKVDASVAKFMSDYWTTFAKYGNPNGMLDVNGLVAGTRPGNAPWWPRLFGELPSEKALIDMHRNAIRVASDTGSETKREMHPQNPYAWDESYRAISDDMSSMAVSAYGESSKEAWEEGDADEKEASKRLHLQNQFVSDIKTILQRSSFTDYHEKYRYLHMLKFDSLTGVRIFENEDCICSALNKLDYKY